MRVFKLVCFLVIIAALCGCDRCDHHIGNEYLLMLSIRDTLGNDLLKDIEYDEDSNTMIKRELIEFYCFPDNDIYLPQAIWPRSVEVYKQLDNNNYNYECLFLYFSHTKCEPTVNEILYRLRCSYIFGDNLLHEIRSYWRPAKTRVSECYRIVYEGKEITGISYNGDYSYAIIILEDK